LTRVIFAIPGDLAARSGGYGYDRHILAELPHCGVEAAHCALPGGFPNPSTAEIERGVASINRDAGADDVVLIDGLAFGALPEGSVSAIRAPIVALCHHPLCLETGLTAERAQSLRMSEKRALALAAHVVVTSAHTQATLAREFGLPPERISVAPPGTDPAARARGSGGAPALLAVGSIIPRKAFDVLVEALASLVDLDWRLRIAGSFDASRSTTLALRRQIEARGLSRRIELLGELSAEELDRAFDAADVFVSPSLYEGYGMALAEALARGLPIVTTTGGAAADTIPDAAALKVPAGDAVALSVALRVAVEDGSLRARLADEAWRAGQALPRWRDAAKIIADVVRKVVVLPK